MGRGGTRLGWSVGLAWGAGVGPGRIRLGGINRIEWGRIRSGGAFVVRRRSAGQGADLPGLGVVGPDRMRLWWDQSDRA